MGAGVVLGGEREERAGGCEVEVVAIGVVIGGCLDVDLGEGEGSGGGGENGGGCDLGSKKVGDGDSYN